MKGIGAAVIATAALGGSGAGAAFAGMDDAGTSASAAAPRVAFGATQLAAPLDGRPALLVEVRYPRHMKGHPGALEVRLLDRGKVVGSARSTPRLSAGLALETADRRRAFSFVHTVVLPGRAAARMLHEGGRVTVALRAESRLDVDRDGRVETRSAASARRAVVPAGAGARLLCGSLPVVYPKTRQVTAVRTPRCSAPVRWSVAQKPARGAVRSAESWVVYRSAARHRGPDGFVLRATPRGAGLRAGAGGREGASTAAGASVAQAGGVTVPVALQVGSGAPSTVSIRAIGDSVTAGYGYYDDGSSMSILRFPGCKPGDTLVDACSSNSLTTSATGRLQYAPDYGLSNLIAWPARWAGWNGVTNFANYAVTGSAPGDWAPGGQFHATTQAAMAAAPDYLVFTLGANPILTNVLTGLDTMGCALLSDLLGDFTVCVERAFAAARLSENLTALYSDLATNTPARTQILVMQYHLAIPASALAYSSRQIERMAELMNATIARQAAAVSPRLRVVSPPRFNVGSDMSPLYPSTYDCNDGGLVDGPSVQSTATQDELEYNPLGGPFCPGPATIGPSDPNPWIISGDTGIHPSVSGHRMFANALPTP